MPATVHQFEGASIGCFVPALSGKCKRWSKGRKLLNFTAANQAHRYLIMDRAYDGDKTSVMFQL